MGKIPKGFDKTKNKAKEYLDDKEKTNRLVEAATEKINKNKNRLSDVYIDLQTLIRMIKSSIKGEYKKIPNKTILLSITAILYFVNPLDLIPDFLIISGFIDDATILGFVIKSIKDDIDKFKTYEINKEKRSD